MKKLLNLSHTLASRSVLLLSSFLLISLGIGTLLVKAYMLMDPSETVLFSGRGWVFYLSFALSPLVLYLINKAFKSLSEKQIFLLFSGLYLVLGLFLIWGVESDIRADAAQVYLAAKDFNIGQFSALIDKAGYLYANPHQLGLVSFERLLLIINQDIRFFFTVYLLLTLGINGLQWRISARLFPKQGVARWSLILSFLFFPQLFFILFLYGSQPGLFFILLAVYAWLRCEQKRSFTSLFGCFLALSLACIIRQNYLIFALTLTLVCLLSAIKHYRWQDLVVAGLMLTSVFISQQLLTKWYEHESGYRVSAGTPKVAYLAMGLRDQSPTNGYWDAYNTNLLAQHDYDMARATKAAQDELANRLAVLGQDPVFAVHFFHEKIMATWLEPTFQSIWSGPLWQIGQEVKGPILHSLYKGGLAYRLFHLLMSHLLIWLYLLAGIAVVKSFLKKAPLSPVTLYPLIFFLGGFLFHLFWETKSQYVYLYVYLLIPWSASGLLDGANWLETILTSKKTLSP